MCGCSLSGFQRNKAASWVRVFVEFIVQQSGSSKFAFTTQPRSRSGSGCTNQLSILSVQYCFTQYDVLRSLLFGMLFWNQNGVVWILTDRHRLEWARYVLRCAWLQKGWECAHSLFLYPHTNFFLYRIHALRFGSAIQAFIESAGSKLYTVDLSRNEYDKEVLVNIPSDPKLVWSIIASKTLCYSFITAEDKSDCKHCRMHNKYIGSQWLSGKSFGSGHGYGESNLFLHQVWHNLSIKRHPCFKSCRMMMRWTFESVFVRPCEPD